MLTDDPNDPRINRHIPGQQNEVYLVLSDEERAKGFVRPVRHSYRHTFCGTVTKMGPALAETYARDPKFYGSTWCMSCLNHLPVGEFTWDGTKEILGS